jgi:hypothetical protein
VLISDLLHPTYPFIYHYFVPFFVHLFFVLELGGAFVPMEIVSDSFSVAETWGLCPTKCPSAISATLNAHMNRGDISFPFEADCID